jgi:hypothetical protein
MLIKAITQPDMQKVQTFPLEGQLFRQKLCDSRHIYTDGTVQSFNLIYSRLLLFTKKIASSLLFDHFKYLLDQMMKVFVNLS